MITVHLNQGRKITKATHKDTSFYMSEPACDFHKKKKYLSIKTKSGVTILNGRQMNTLKRILA